MKREIWTDFNTEKLLNEIKSCLSTIDDLCDGINDHCEQILDDVDLLNTLRLVRDINEYSKEIQKITNKLNYGDKNGN